jgi:hypothetical protein
MRTKPCLHCLPKSNTNPGPLKTGKNHFGEMLCGISITPQSEGRGNVCGAPPQTALANLVGEFENRQKHAVPWTFSREAWTYVHSSPTQRRRESFP